MMNLRQLAGALALAGLFALAKPAQLGAAHVSVSGAKFKVSQIDAQVGEIALAMLLIAWIIVTVQDWRRAKRGPQ